jgi:hypothetical protein
VRVRNATRCFTNDIYEWHPSGTLKLENGLRDSPSLWQRWSKGYKTGGNLHTLSWYWSRSRGMYADTWWGGGVRLIRWPCSMWNTSMFCHLWLQVFILSLKLHYLIHDGSNVLQTTDQYSVKRLWSGLSSLKRILLIAAATFYTTRLSYANHHRAINQNKCKYKT